MTTIKRRKKAIKRKKKMFTEKSGIFSVKKRKKKKLRHQTESQEE